MTEFFPADEDQSLVFSRRSGSMPWFDRIDPLYEVDWKDLVRTEWDEVSATKIDLTVDSAGFLVKRKLSYFSPIQESQKFLYSPLTIIAVASLSQWHILTTFQVATMLDITRQRAFKLMWRLHGSGMVSRLIPDWWDGSIDDSGSGSIWKLDRRSWTTERWFEGLGNLEWSLITNGNDPTIAPEGSTTRTALRHNLATTEIALKAMEVCPSVVGSWGDVVSRADILHQASPYDRDEIRNNIGDGVIVTRSGKIIVLETAGTNNASARGTRIVEKAAGWTAICGKSDLDIAVVFVDISNSYNSSSFVRSVGYGAEEISRNYISRAEVKKKGAERVFTVSARDWFPMPRSIAEGFTTLNVYCPASQQDVELAPLIDGYQTPDDLVINTVAAMHTPRWINRPVKMDL